MNKSNSSLLPLLRKIIEQSALLIIFLLPLQSSYGQTSSGFETALSQMQSMFNGQQALSFEEAVFLTEKAYLDDSLETEAWRGNLDALEAICLAISQSRTLLYEGDDKAALSIHAAIFTAMTDTLTLKVGDAFVRTHPFRYDFADIWGRSDWPQMFVSKLLRTGAGNCHSMPYLYKILADRLGVRAWLSTAPNHLYIKNHCESYGWYNTELTSGMFPTDAWLMASGFVHLDAIKNGVYLDTLTEKECIALCLVDLAQGYEHKLGPGNEEFIQRCCSLALDHYPHCINAMLMLAESMRRQLQASSTAPQSADLESPDGSFSRMEELYAKIHRLGYRRMPEEMYSSWLASLETERAKFQNTQASKSHQLEDK